MNYLLHKQTCMYMYWLDSISPKIKKLLFNKVHTFILYTTPCSIYIKQNSIINTVREFLFLNSLEEFLILIFWETLVLTMGVN